MSIVLWCGFAGVLCALVAIELALLTRRPRAISPVEARHTLALWIMGTVGFAIALASVYQTDWRQLGTSASMALDGQSAFLQFITCYVVEAALGLENVAVLALLLAYYKVPAKLVPRTLFWCILLSLVLRLGLVSGAAATLGLIPHVQYVLFGALVLAMVRMLLFPSQPGDLARRRPVRFVEWLLGRSDRFDGQRLFTRSEDGSGGLAATPLFKVVLIATMSDMAFAIDSVPALFSVTRDPAIAYAASAMALMSMRSLYFSIAPFVGRFRFLKLSLVVVLGFIAVKVALNKYANVSTGVALAVVSGAMMLAIGFSGVWARAHPAKAADAAGEVPTPLEDLAEVPAIARRNLRKVLILIAGTTLIIVGIIIAPLPGPGPSVLVPIALGLLATEFVWAKTLLDRLKTGVFNLSDRADEFVDRTTVWMVPLIIVGYWLVAFGAREVIHIPWTLWFVIFGSPFTPLAAWAVRYIRRVWKESKQKRTGPQIGLEPVPTAGGANTTRGGKAQRGQTRGQSAGVKSANAQPSTRPKPQTPPSA